MGFFHNHYECPRCGAEWIDEWDCGCDDRCPHCNLSCSPVASDEISEDDDAASE